MQPMTVPSQYKCRGLQSLGGENMLKIKDMEVGKSVEATLLVKSSESKITKTGKSYLFVVLTDGQDDLQGQEWDWGDKNIPPKNITVDVTGTISEYMGKKQIKLSTIKRSDAPISDFAPQGDVNVDDYITTYRTLIDTIENEEASSIVHNIVTDHFEDFKTLPAAKGVHHAFVSGLLKHSVDVTLKARAIAKFIKEVNMDLVTAGALIHDIGKIKTYELQGALIEMTDQGQYMEHLVLGATMVEKYRTEANTNIVDLLQHIIASHHGKLEYGSPVTPRFLEAWIVNYADGIDAKAQTILEANAKVTPDAKFTDKIWTLNNREMYTTHYIKSIMQVEEY